MSNKGQVSTEYLVILAVVLVIALVVVYLVGGFSGTGAGSIETQSRNYWGTASPFAITAFNASGTALELEIANNDADTLTITDISLGGASVYSENLVLSSGGSKAISAKLPVACGASGAPFTYNNVVITYDKGSLTGVTQAGTKPLVGKCS